MTKHEAVVAAMQGGISRQPPTPPPAPSRSDKSRSRSGGDAGGRCLTRTNSVNVTIAQLVVSKDVVVEDLVWLLRRTPANIVVINFDVWAEGNTIRSTLSNALTELNGEGESWLRVWMQSGVVLGKSARIWDMRFMLKIDDGPHTFMYCECATRRSRLSQEGTVVIGLLASQKKRARLRYGMDEVGALRSGGEPSALHLWRLLAWEGREREALQVSQRT